MPLTQDDRMEIQMRLDRSVAAQPQMTPTELILFKRIWREGFIEGMGFGALSTARAYEESISEALDDIGNTAKGGPLREDQHEPPE